MKKFFGTVLQSSERNYWCYSVPKNFMDLKNSTRILQEPDFSKRYQGTFSQSDGSKNRKHLALKCLHKVNKNEPFY